MDNRTLHVLLIEDNPGDAELVRDMLSHSGSDFQVHWADGLLTGLDCIARESIDVVLLDLSLPDSQGLGSLHAIGAHAPSLPIVVLTGYDSQTLAVEAVQNGAQDYLPKSRLEAVALVRAIRYAVARQATQVEPPGEESRSQLGRVVGFVGAKGGVGTTTIACHVACAMQRSLGRATLLDLDMSANSVGFLMKAESPHTVVDIADNILRLDLRFWKKSVWESPDGLDVIRSSGPSSSDEEVRAERIRYILRFLRQHYLWVFVDLGRLRQSMISLVGELTDIFLVSGAEVMSLYAAKHGVGKLAGTSFDPSRMHLILNRVPPRFFMSEKELEQLVGTPIYAELPDESADLTDALASGKLLDDRSDLGKHIRRLIAKLSGVEEKDKGKDKDKPDDKGDFGKHIRRLGARAAVRWFTGKKRGRPWLNLL